MIQTQIESYGSCHRVYKDRAKQYAVLNIDDKYSPKLKLYSLATGVTGDMKVKKPYFTKNKLAVGNIITVDQWTKKNVRIFQDGKSIPVNGKFEIWIDQYTII